MMNIVTLIRDQQGDEGTFGELNVHEGDYICKTGELPWRDNQRGESCIPDGTYQVIFMERSGSGKFKNCYHVQDVPGRSAILIHAGNFCGDTKLGYKSDVDGCILVGKGRGQIEGQQVVSNSKRALKELNEVLGQDPFWLTIWTRT